MAQINTKLLDAKSRQTDASTRYNELTRDTGSPVGPASTLQSPTMTNLRSQYATLKQRYDALTMTYGPRYPELINTQRQIAGLEQQIAAERSRILQSAKVDLDQANAVVDALNAQAATARSAVALDNDAQVQLSDLERDMTAKVSIYNTFLTRSTETHQRQQLDATNIRVISTAIPPIRRWFRRHGSRCGARACSGLPWRMAEKSGEPCLILLHIGVLRPVHQSRHRPMI
jgi:uncharacterized protein involved in exopolysaccharide biosynthesis